MKRRRGGMMSGCMWMEGGTREGWRRGRAEAKVKGQLVNPHCPSWADKGRREGSECTAEWTTGEHTPIRGCLFSHTQKKSVFHAHAASFWVHLNRLRHSDSFQGLQKEKFEYTVTLTRAFFSRVALEVHVCTRALLNTLMRLEISFVAVRYDSKQTITNLLLNIDTVHSHECMSQLPHYLKTCTAAVPAEVKSTYGLR